MIKIYSAPLQGYTDAAWRNAHETIFGGVDAYFSPFVRIERGEFRNKDIKDIEPLNNKVMHFVPQIIASEEDELRRLTDLVIEKGYNEIDINMGCPFPLITRKYKGCGILPYPDKVRAIMNVMQDYKGIEFSVKMRLGLEDKDEWKNILPILNDTHLKSVTLHPRIGRQQYKGDVDMDSFASFYDECKLPLIYNGDIKKIDDIEKISKEFPLLDGIMIGRGLLANPSLAYEYKNGINMPDKELYNKIIEMHSFLFDYYSNTLQGESQILNKMKTFWEYLLPDMDKKIHKAIKKSSSLNKYLTEIRFLKNLY